MRTKRRAQSGQRRNVRNQILLWVGVVATILFCLFPFYWIINTSLKTGAELSQGALFPHHPSLDNYSSIFKNSDFTTALRTSLIDAGAATLIALTVGSFCAYALARLRFPMKFLLLAIVLSISTFPPIAIAAPLFKLWTDIGLYNTYIGLILPFLTFVLPLTIYILTSFFREIPKELEEAALVDGATHFQAFRKVVLPLAAPGLVTAGLLAFIFAWNEFLLSITLTSDPSTASRVGGNRFLHRELAVPDPDRDDQRRDGDHHGAVDRARGDLPEADRGGLDGGRAEGLRAAARD